MSKPRDRRRFPEEFKRKAVEATMRKGVKVQDVADELGVSAQYLSQWRSKYLRQNDIEQVEKRVDALAENRRLKDENRTLKMELEILKKAACYFASQK